MLLPNQPGLMFFGLFVRLSHPYRGPLRHVCGHTNHSTTMFHTFLESPSNLDVHPRIHFWLFKKFRRNWRLKVHYMAMTCSQRGPLRYVCGQTIDPTAMICTFLESPTDLDVHPGKRFAFFGRNRRNWRRQVGTQNNEICSMLPGQTRVESHWLQIFCAFLTFSCNALFLSFSSSDFEKSGKFDV